MISRRCNNITLQVRESAAAGAAKRLLEALSTHPQLICALSFCTGIIMGIFNN